MSKSKNDIAWEKIFEKHKILDAIAAHGSVSIASSHINEFREARLMTKFDHRSQLPVLFDENKLSVLPTSRGGYEIGKFETFCDFIEEDIEITPINFPTFLESIDYKDITSEATAINCAFDAAKEIGVHSSNIYRSIYGQISNCKGYIWKYVE